MLLSASALTNAHLQTTIVKDITVVYRLGPDFGNQKLRFFPPTDLPLAASKPVLKIGCARASGQPVHSIPGCYEFSLSDWNGGFAVQGVPTYLESFHGQFLKSFAFFIYYFGLFCFTCIFCKLQLFSSYSKIFLCRPSSTVVPLTAETAAAAAAASASAAIAAAAAAVAVASGVLCITREHTILQQRTS